MPAARDHTSVRANLNRVHLRLSIPHISTDWKMSNVPYIDSTALGTLVSTYVSRHRMRRQVALSGVCDQVSKTLKITKVESLFLLFPTLEDALTRLDEASNA